jgi:acyl carrier protein
VSRKIMEIVIQTVEKHLDMHLEPADLQKTLEDLGADSLDQVQISLAIEEELKIYITDEAIFGFQDKGITEISQELEKIVHGSEGK